ncbi:thermonuclease family protein [Jannaschia sp. LMIT008]|uniref:thermonuclease family protein n=1 Tax=Jannaschia maritima TaxID=3032585 RepID=UPI002811985B|nr:thermonuclease family protein [Jannaschia sp. LMIT008]
MAVAAEPQSVTITGVAKVFDGDTLDIGPVRIRLHGIDAPESRQSCTTSGGGTWACGAAAASRLSVIVEGGPIACEALDRDPYGRIIARCRADGADIGETLVTEGLAWAFLEYSTEYAGIEASARTAGLGIWQAPTQTPWAYRDDRWARAVAASPDGCPIKGNVNGNERIYHTPWSPNYDATRIDTAKDERWFCNEAEATAAGWRARRSR